VVHVGIWKELFVYRSCQVVVCSLRSVCVFFNVAMCCSEFRWDEVE